VSDLAEQLVRNPVAESEEIAPRYVINARSRPLMETVALAIGSLQ
jgi:hypothetical protein